MESPSLTGYYGCMHAFTSVLAGELTMVRDLSGRLEGHRPLHAFGWQAALDRARRRATAILERWRRLNETLASGVPMDAFERRVFGQNPVTADQAVQTAHTLSETMNSLNGRIDGMHAYGAEEVRWIYGVVDEMVQAIGPETRASALVASYLERSAPVDQKVRVEGADRASDPGDPVDGNERLPATYYHAFSRARDEFRADLDG